MEKDTRVRAEEGGRPVRCAHCRKEIEGTPIGKKSAHPDHLEEHARIDERAPLT
ncbi:MAG: hypothetical protein ACOX6T_03835 [Myxococcales bacterium]|jgi:hypothetical protein